jgi:hypothetical protein
MVQVANAAPNQPTVPEEIRVPDGNKLFLVGHAEGVQTYECKDGAWHFVEPTATLEVDNEEPIKHYAGPTWEAADGSLVKASPTANVTVDPTAIPWLLLTVTSTAGPADGLLANTTYIQRVATEGGLAPDGRCGKGDTADVPYEADYYFWQRNGKKPA